MATEPPWLSPLQKCLQDAGSNPTARFFQLATLTSHGKPSCRTHVFRGWHTHPSSSSSDIYLKTVTDQRSHKISGLNKYPWAEACWYFLEARQQYRLTGTITLVNAETKDQALSLARVEQWQALSNSARLQFKYPPPGELRVPSLPSNDGTTGDDNVEANGKRDPFQPPPPSETEPEDCFVLALLKPEQVDLVDLRQNMRKRFEKGKDGRWTSWEINP